MKQILKKGATDQSVVIFIPDSSSTSGAGKTGLAYNTASLTCYYVRPGSAAAQLSLVTQTVTGAHTDGGFVEIDATNMPGVYRLDLSDAILASGVNSAVVMLKGASGMAPVPLEIQLTDFDLNTATQDVNVTKIGGTTQTARDIGTSVLLAADQAVNVTKWKGSTAPDKMPSTLAAADVTGNLPANILQWNTGSLPTVGTSTLTAQQVWEYATRTLSAFGFGVTVSTNNDKTGYSLIAAYDAAKTAGTSTLTAQQVWEYATRTLSAFGFGVTVATNNDKTGYTLTVTPPTAAAVADAVWDEVISGHLTSGTTGNALNAAGSAGDPWSTSLPGSYGAGTAGKIIGDNINATISSRSSHSASDIWSVGTRTLTSFGTLVSDIWGAATRTLTAISDSTGITTLLSRIASALTITGGKVDVNDKSGFSLATTPPTAADIKTALEANGSKLDHLWEMTEDDSGVRRLTTNALELAPTGGGSSLTVQDIVNGVLDEALSGHDAAGTAGAALAASGAAADPLASLVPGTYAAGTAGAVLGSYIPSPGTGSVSYNYTLTETGGTTPIRGVDVRVSTDAAGANIVAYAVTNYSGIASFLLDPGTYYFWRQKTGYTFTDPDVEVVS